MEFIFVYLCFCALVGVAASKYGLSGISWFFLAMLISPLLAIVFVWGLGKPYVAPAADPLAAMTRIGESSNAADDCVYF
jgi:hypothetical protein